ncbi:type IV pili methyl-accepting chemotaxis transducer N-terminal domain-containing protein [Andreprevotia chitinilytica]|uniref:type IV pili methyl-accepting chemotaxis transducer N-terminal domain-containing protein n=1 Tax=Andreprevotia chitinilytica TaxID=396808 RepID=UPI001FDFA4B5|nr:type IV pili methyl-accepting chemotaxis transducer N-terminal domain-containing protein [Andreprevotia chitinilytica]
MYALVLFGAVESVAADALNVNSAINKAGSQRMLSQRMAKAYCQVGLGVETESSKHILDQSVTLFDKQLGELKAFAPTPEIKDTYAKLAQVWLSYKELLAGSKPNIENARKIALVNEDVLKLAQQGTAQFEKYSGSPGGKLINIAGRQRMLSQRMAKFNVFRAWGITSPQMLQDLDAAAKEFATAQDVLLAAPQNTPQITRELQLAKTQWFFFDDAIKQTAGSRDDQLKNVATTSERILQVMDGVTWMYEGIAK